MTGSTARAVSSITRMPKATPAGHPHPARFRFRRTCGTKKTAIGDARAVMDHLRTHPDEDLTSADGNVKIYFNQRAGRATIEVAGAKRLGGVYYLDAPDRIVGDFSKAGGKMTARTTEAKLEPAIGQLQKLGATFAAVKELPPAEEVGAAGGVQHDARTAWTRCRPSRFPMRSALRWRPRARPRRRRNGQRSPRAKGAADRGREGRTGYRRPDRAGVGVYFGRGARRHGTRPAGT